MSKFYTLIKTDEQVNFTPVYGKITKISGFKYLFFAYQCQMTKVFHIVEARSGMSLAHSFWSISEALQDAKKQLRKHAQEMDQVIESTVSKYGESPLWSRYSKLEKNVPALPVIEFDSWLELGSAPWNEDCAQVGDPDYMQKAREECERYIRQLRALHGPEPEGAKFKIKSNPHDFGSYLEVRIYFDSCLDKASEYAYKLEEEAPQFWTVD